MSHARDELSSRIASGKAVVGVVGLGYVGLPLSLTFARKGVKVVGFDIDPKKIEALEAGRSYLEHLPVEDLGELVGAGMLSPTTDYGRAGECDALLLCVPTPLTRHREPDMSYVEGTARALAPHLRPGQLVILESTTYPGTTRDLLWPLLEEGSGLKVGEELFLAYSPEREDPGNPDFDTQRIPKLVGGLDAPTCEAATALYRLALDEVIPVSSAQVAEMAKIYENVFRAINIALVNELKVLCDKMEMDVWEVIDAAATKPFGFMRFTPGPGLGGHCIPIDPFYLTWKAREFGISTRFIELAGEINNAMPAYVVDRCTDALNDEGKALKGSRVLVLGVAYKPDVDDMRESPALPIMKLLEEKGAEVQFHDPHVALLKPSRKHKRERRSVDLDAARLQATDLVLIVTDHRDVDYGLVGAETKLVVDTRNAMARVDAPRSRVVKA
ncbi:MAG: nucleotide sugar dehydrogenase [Deltaproteobacteria bacterium]|nr:nucleotide sugar dehydrogenase [Deltaproteobacteria bacterium]